MWTEAVTSSDVWRKNPPECYRLVSHESIFWYCYYYKYHFYVTFFKKKRYPPARAYIRSAGIYMRSAGIYMRSLYEISNIFFRLLPKKRGWGWHKNVISSNGNTIILIVIAACFLFYMILKLLKLVNVNFFLFFFLKHDNCLPCVIIFFNFKI